MRGRGRRISIYVADRSAAERAFWDAVTECTYPFDHPRAGRVRWAEFAQYLAELVLEDRKHKKPADLSDPIKQEIHILRQEIVQLKSMVQQRGEAPLKPDASDQERNGSELAKKAAKLAEDDW